MYHPFKKLETAWNARTPVYLHNRTKENLIFQLSLVAVGTIGVIAYTEIKERTASRRLAKLNIEVHDPK